MSQERQSYPEIATIECKACGRCVEACPKHVLFMSEDFNARGYHYVEYLGRDCIGCARCFHTCPEPYALRIHLAAKETKGQ